MNKDQLKQELLKKIKPGIKPSDLKKQQPKPGPNLSQRENIVPTKPLIPTPPLKPKPEKTAIPPIVQEPNQPKPKPFTCPSCRTTKKQTPVYLRVAQNDPEYNLIKGQQYPFCSSCAPKIKEYNEHDLLNDNPHLWTKYPHSSASEILELEFNIKKEETW